jgi:hypothetical protein
VIISTTVITIHYKLQVAFNTALTQALIHKLQKLCNMQQQATMHATTQHATRNTQHATRNTQHVTRNTQHAITQHHVARNTQRYTAHSNSSMFKCATMQHPISHRATLKSYFAAAPTFLLSSEMRPTRVWTCTFGIMKTGCLPTQVRRFTNLTSLTSLRGTSTMTEN